MKLKVANYFPTPRHLVLRLLDRIQIYPGDLILEPSAGKGNIADAVREYFPNNRIRVCELNPKLAQILKNKGYHGVCGDFLKHQGKYDVIIANPPFCNGITSFPDIDHFRHAWDLLTPGGRMAFIMHAYSAFPVYMSGKPGEFARFLNKIGASKEMNPPGSFVNSERPTQTSTCIVWAAKPIDVSYLLKTCSIITTPVNQT